MVRSGSGTVITDPDPDPTRPKSRIRITLLDSIDPGSGKPKKGRIHYMKSFIFSLDWKTHMEVEEKF
jgi:hypothetical protein